VVSVVVFSRQQLCCSSAAALVSSFPSKVGQFSFECCPLSQRSVLGSPPAFFWSLLDASGSSRWLACCPTLLSAFAALWCITESLVLRVQFLAPTLTVQKWEIYSLLHPLLQGRFNVPPPLPMLVLDYSFLFMVFSFAGGCSVCSVTVLDFFPWVGW
jgi:hypothetical protein